MNEETNADILQRAARQAAQRPFFLAGDLAAYQSLYGMGEEQMADYLGCSTESLAKLALCRRPGKIAPHFGADVERIAAYAGVDSVRLAAILREVESVASLRNTQAQDSAARERGFLMAARDRAEQREADERKPRQQEDHPESDKS
ncbi:MAG: hypothetical protein L0177_19940 [Chloroflexi bacterium]|nr:hypothetical protein [Chloroflexota bacterium]